MCRFRIRSRGSITKVFAPPFEHLLVINHRGPSDLYGHYSLSKLYTERLFRPQENVTASSQGLLPCLISVIGAMSVDEVIIKKLASREEFWKSSFSAMVYLIISYDEA